MKRAKFNSTISNSYRESKKIQLQLRMEKTHPFYDLCIPYQKDEKALREIIKEAISCKIIIHLCICLCFLLIYYICLMLVGYKTIAIEQVFDHSRRDATKRVPDIFPSPVALKSLEDEFKNQVKILQRLTILYVDVSVAHAMVNKFRISYIHTILNCIIFQTNSLNLKKYNLVAGQPKTDAALTVI